MTAQDKSTINRMRAVVKVAERVWKESSEGGVSHNSDAMDTLAGTLNRLEDHDAGQGEAHWMTVADAGTVVIDGETMECVVLTGDRDAIKSLAWHMYETVEVVS